MKTIRLEAFSDGVLAIIITIMVLELKVPHAVELAALKPVLPVLLSYVLSFIYIGIYWNNHHHLFQATEQVSGGILWANLHLLFWLSLFPFTTAWIGESHVAVIPTAIYGSVLSISRRLPTMFSSAPSSPNKAASCSRAGCWQRLESQSLSRALPRRDPSLAFVGSWIASALYVFGALLWLIPDPRIEKALKKRGPDP